MSSDRLNNSGFATAWYRAAVFLLLSVLVSVAHSQGEVRLEEIVVTATKTGETNLQETPIAITAFSSEELERSVVSDVRDLAHSTPGLVISENTGFSQLFIRGVGSNNIFSGSDPSSTIHIDGVYIARPAGGFTNFVDVERVEVLRGPQGTLYGRNSIGGTVNVISRKPSLNEFNYKGRATFGNEDIMRFDVYASVPLIEDKLAVSAAFQHSEHDGFRENVSTGVDVDDEDDQGFRGQLLWQATDSTEVIVRGDYSKSDSVPYGFGTLVEPAPAIAPLSQSISGDFGKIAHNLDESGSNETWGISIEINADINETWSIKSLTAYREQDVRLQIDSDASDFNALRTTLLEPQDQISQEINLTGDFANWQVILGAYYINEEIDASTMVEIFALGSERRVVPVTDTTAWAVFAQATYAVTDKLSLTAGIRYTDEEKEFSKGDGIFVSALGIEVVPLSFPPETGNYSALTPKFGIEYQANDELLLYASATRGFKSGGFNMTASTPGGFSEEIIWSYEAGIKSELMDNKMRLNITGFYYDYTDLQVQAFLVPGSVDVTNAASADVYGVELEALAKPTEALDLSFNLAYLDASYKDYIDAPVSAAAGGGTTDASGNRLNNSPEWSYSLAAQFTQPVQWGSIYVRGEYNWQDEVFYTADNNAVSRQGGYGLFNASVGFVSQDERLELSIWGRNLTDKEYVTGVAPFTLVRAGRAGPPQTFGVSISYRN